MDYETERRTRAAHARALPGLAHKVCSALTGTTKDVWTVEGGCQSEYDNYVTLRSSDAMLHLGMAYMSGKWRLNCYATWPPGWHGHLPCSYTRAEVTFAFDRDPGQIARRVAKQVVPVARDLLSQLTERHNDEVERKRVTQAMDQRVRDRFGEDIRYSRIDDDGQRLKWDIGSFNSDPQDIVLNAEFNGYHPGHTHLTLDAVPNDVAFAIATVIRNHNAAQKGSHADGGKGSEHRNP